MPSIRFHSTAFFFFWLVTLSPIPGLPGEDKLRELHAAWEGEIESNKARRTSSSEQEFEAARVEINRRYTHLFSEFAKESSDSDRWLSCLMWLAQYGVSGEDLDSAIGLLSERATSIENGIQLQLSMSLFIPVQSKEVDPALLSITASKTDRGVRGAALMALAARRKTSGELEGDIERCNEAVALLERVKAEFPNVRTYQGLNSEVADTLLMELGHDRSIGKISPPISGLSLHGEEVHLAPTTMDSVLLVCFSGHWCGPCRKMHSVLRELHNNHPPEQLKIVEINSDKPENLESVKERIESEGLSWTTICDHGIGEISQAWMLQASPTYVLIDQTGTIRHRMVGANGPKLVELVEGLIGQQD